MQFLSTLKMAFTLPIHFLILLHILLLFAFSTPQTPNLDAICSKTLFPSFCTSTLNKNHLNTNTIQDYGQFCINQSLYIAKNLNLLLNHQLKSYNNNKFASKITNYALQDCENNFVSQFTTNYALQDCEFLTRLNIDFLATIADIIKPTDSLGSIIDTKQVQTMLSAALTNLDTCSDGLIEAHLQSSLLANVFLPQISNATMLLSLSLALFTEGWVPKTNPNGNILPLKFEEFRKTIKHYDNNSKNNGRIMLQIGEIGIIVNTMVVVNPNGSGDFTTISDAIDAAPKNAKPNSGYFGIHVVGGIYEEYVSIPSNKKYLLMVGDGINNTIITGNRSYCGGWTTYKSATFAVTGVGFVAANITFRNTAGAEMHLAVAVRNGADLSTFYKCSFEGYQDTLYAHSMRQFYRECDIYGTVDFIFGNAAAVFQNCNLYGRQPFKGQYNLITAQGRTDPNQNTGFSIHNSVIKVADDLASSTYTVETYLGRPWKEFSRTVYMQSFMGCLIEPVGWHEWSQSFALDTLYYAEYNNNGPGSTTSNRVNWPGYHVIDEAVASYFTVSYFIDGEFWLPSTGVPYTLGLFPV